MNENTRDPARILVSDIDGTLLDDGRPTAGLSTLVEALSGMNPVHLVYATGRTFESTRKLVSTRILPRPDAVASMVGTEIWLPPWQKPDTGFRYTISTGWERRTVLEEAAGLSWLKPQPDRFQSPIKASFYLSDPGRIPILRCKLRSRGVKARLIYSGGKYLDVIPEEASKLNAVEYLRRLWSVKPSNVLAAGDSGNDLDMLREPHFLGVAVGNSEKKLKRLSDQETFHLASRQFAAGVLEGALKFNFLSHEFPRPDAPAGGSAA